MLPAYAEWVQGVIESGSADPADEVFTTSVVWLIDTGALDAATPLIEFAIAHGLQSADEYQRSLPTLLIEQMGEQIAAGRVREDQAQIVWRSAPLPNDALAVRHDLDAATKAAVAAAALAITPEVAQRVMPANYTGWVPATSETYAPIEAAGRALNRLRTS